MPTTFTIQHLEQLQAAGKIRGFVTNQVEVKKKSKQGKVVAKHFKRKSQALDWLGWNLLIWCQERCLQLYEEFRFDANRKWRFDWAIPDKKIAVEFEGGVFEKKGGHTTAKGYTKDTEKYNRAAQLGWIVLRYTALNYKNIIDDLKNAS